MESQSLKLNVSESIAEVSADWTQASQSTATLTLAHGAGAGMNHPFMVAWPLNWLSKTSLRCDLIFHLLKTKNEGPMCPQSLTKQLRLL